MSGTDPLIVILWESPGCCPTSAGGLARFENYQNVKGRVQKLGRRLSIHRRTQSAVVFLTWANFHVSRILETSK